MNLIKEACMVLKMEVDFRLATPLLLRSGKTGDVTDSSIERTHDGRLFINGYVWASLLRRCLDRLPGGGELASAIGKYRESGGASPLWCEHTLTKLHGTSVNPGIAIYRKWGAAKAGALYSDELAVAGLPLHFRFNLFLPDESDAESESDRKSTIWRKAILDALRLVDQGIENIGGGWGYGFGRLHVQKIRFSLLDLRNSEDRRRLWQWENIAWEEISLLPTMPKTVKAAAVISVKARIADGQLMAVKTGVFPIDAPDFGKLPDTFVFRRNRWENDCLQQGPVIPGKAIRQALLSAPLERKFRSLGETICEPSEKGSCQGKCRRCRWFGNTEAAGVVAVTDAEVLEPSFQVVSRVQLCEHSMQNMNLFSGEYLTAGSFNFDIIVDGSRVGDADALVDEINALLNEMKGGDAPSGWYRVGGTATCSGQVEIISYETHRSDKP